MGFIQAFTGALGGAFANQWIDFLTVPEGIAPTAAVFQAVPQGTNAGRGANTKGSTGIITNGSKILVPEGYGLITLQDGAVTGFISDAGGYIFSSDDQNSKSMFSGGGIFSSTLKTSWEQFKRGGQPGSQQLALFVNLKEIPNNRFGTQSEIYWDDAYVNAQVGALARGTYTLRIVDPILFVKGFVPASYITEGQVFDFGDFDNPAASQLFSEVVASLAQAFSIYSNDPNKDHRITKLQSDSVGFAASLSKAVEDNYNWKTSRGLEIEKVAIAAIEYDEDTRALLSDVKKADALSGNRSGSFLNQAIARGVQGAGENGGGEGLLGFGFGAGAVGGLIQPQGGQVGPQTNQGVSPDDGLVKLQKAKAAFDAGLISEEDYKKAKADYLGL
jgi:membrane protease subunit (stomatin/prohibitin family)